MIILKKKWFWIIYLSIFSIIIHSYCNSSVRVERGYSKDFYPNLALFFRTIYGWLPFSLGDILYGFVLILLFKKTFQFFRLIIQNKISKKGCIISFQNLILIFLSVYIIFNTFWGINYNRQSIYNQLNLKKMDSVNYETLKAYCFLLVDKMNTTKQSLLNSKTTYPNNKLLFKQVENAYENVNHQYSFLQYKSPSIKPSLWSWAAKYIGFAGYYNPFTGEAQLNTHIPKFSQPFIACHEVAHQLGYALEDEASAVGFLAAENSKDTLLLYSTYYDLFKFARYDLMYQSFINNDTTINIVLNNYLSPAVKADKKIEREYYNKNHSRVEPFMSMGYNMYLKNNQMPKGIDTYNEISLFVMAYWKKLGLL